ncbi:Peptidoglycan-N-acetylmuramic acid deacetylase PdaC [Pirellulimonas nuda]|uniref:Peptidoglycan-N-acetylmuramic acid deacetylase PdaC n=1 Tax=Pirellulimonas nuda TaxID=2528009 RepID=A0A518D818_9BACT|nr:polysaccharide deacetylase family protein [Pirellulimonas nuda]QDU87632.1 Peptidoglycan-N-acetylmuramic acid deacetylase PdaC [Pirellulimonas nuda]
MSKPTGARVILRNLATACFRWALLIVVCVLIAIGLAVLGCAPHVLLGYGLGGVGAFGAAAVVVMLMGVALALLSWSFGPKRLLLSLLLLFVGASLLLTFPPKWAIRCFEEPGGPVFFLPTAEPLAALTIDDGVDPATTPLILEVLRTTGARATFFVLAESAEAHPELVEQIVREGHELGNHQIRDVPAVTLTPDELARQLNDADAILRRFGPVRWLRPGGGFVNDDVKRVAKRLDCQIALGSAFPMDPYIHSPRFVAAYLLGRVQPGAIVVLHDCGARGERTATALAAAIPQIEAQGIKLVTLSELAEASRN